jgi:hypothetical protein
MVCGFSALREEKLHTKDGKYHQHNRGLLTVLRETRASDFKYTVLSEDLVAKVLDIFPKMGLSRALMGNSATSACPSTGSSA